MNLWSSDRFLSNGRHSDKGARVTIGLLTVCSLLLLFLVFVSLPLSVVAEETSFAIISDTHVGSVDSVYSSLIQILKNERIHLIIHAGDAISDPGDAIQWKRFFALPGTGLTIHVAGVYNHVYIFIMDQTEYRGGKRVGSAHMRVAYDCKLNFLCETTKREENNNQAN